MIGKLPSVCTALLYEDDDLFVVNKPPGLLSVPGKGAQKYDSVQSRCAELCPGAMAVHRLDMATGGLLLIAKHKAAERYYKQLFAQRQVEKRYIAVAHGEITADSGEMRFPLIVDWENRPKQKICYETGKPSHTAYRVIARENGCTRVALIPHTGRSHQLRVHLAGIGHPIVGDEWYGYPQDAEQPRLFLHAEYIAFRNRHGFLQSFHISPDF